MSRARSTKCPTPTSTDGKGLSEVCTAPSGALSPRQITALIQQGKWWPFDRVDGKILTALHKASLKLDPVEEAPW
jgi:hypothetical protein